MFSKSRTKLVGWFNEEYNDAWGAEDHDFAAKCYHSGMRLRYSMELAVIHQWHPKNIIGYKRNLDIWQNKSAEYREHLNEVTPYKPKVGIGVINTTNHKLINKRLQGIFRNNIPAKVMLINNGRTRDNVRRTCGEWSKRWAVTHVEHKHKAVGKIGTDVLIWARQNGFDYYTVINDDESPEDKSEIKLTRVKRRKP